MTWTRLENRGTISCYFFSIYRFFFLIIAQCINKSPAVNTTRKSSNIRFGRKESCWPYSFKLATHEHYWGYLTQLGCQTSLTSLVLYHLAYTIYIFNVLSDASWFCNLVSPKCNLHKKVTYFYLFNVSCRNFVHRYYSFLYILSKFEILKLCFQGLKAFRIF